jgi:GNAT superfamily N-acetyltransferase
VDSRHQGKGYGKIILAEALKTVCAYAEHIGTKGVIVDAKDDESEKFYLKFGFIKSLEPGKRRLFIPISTIKTAID